MYVKKYNLCVTSYTDKEGKDHSGKVGNAFLNENGNINCEIYKGVTLKENKFVLFPEDKKETQQKETQQ